MSLEAQVRSIADAFSGTLGVCAVNMTTGERLELRAHEPFSTASTIKLSILYQVWLGVQDGRWRLEDSLTLTRDNKAQGSGVLQDLAEGLRLTVRDAAVLMIVISDNTATNMLIDLCSVDQVNRSMADLGIQEMRLHKKIGAPSPLPLGEATPASMARLLELIGTRQVLTPAACDEMVDILKRQRFKENTSRYIAAAESEIGEPEVQIASKSGWVRAVRNDVALVWAPRATYVLSMFSRDCLDRRYHPDNEAALALARVSEAVYQAWGEPRQKD